jgi:spermidine synthase
MIDYRPRSRARLRARHVLRPRGAALSPTSRAGGVAFLTAAATLFLEVLVHRIISAKLLNNFAFLVISLTMLGFAMSGVVLTRWLDSFLARLEDALSASAALFVLSVLAVAAAFYHADVGPQFPAMAGNSMALYLLRWVPLALLFAAPFTFCGLILGALLSSPRLPARRIYFFDLAGSAVGAYAVVEAIGGWGVEWALLAACVAMLAGTVLLAPPPSRGPRLLVAAAAAAILAAALGRATVFDMRYPAGSMLSLAQSGGAIEHVAWDPVSRIEVSRIPPVDPAATMFPSLIGRDPAFLARFRRMITQNNYAFTYAVDYDGRRESLEGIGDTIYSAAYEAGTPSPRVLVIGVGGGFDVLTALYFGASQVTGVEINAATVRILTRTYRDYFSRWVSDPRVRLVSAEGRHFLATTPGTYDVIQLSGVDSYSGTAAAAYVFSENYLYTAEAFDLYMKRLSPQGILNVMRLEFPFPREMLRALTTAVGALRRAGVPRPSDHIITITQRNGIFTAMLVKRTPFTDEEQDRIERWAAKSPLFKVSAGPRLNANRQNMYQIFLALADQGGERRFVAAYPLDISPPTDDRPFFFHYSFWRHLFFIDPLARDSVPVMELSLVLLSALVAVVAALGVYVPLRALAAEGSRARGAWRYAVFFAGTGVGYMALEIALLQKFGLFLGHPNYALSVVLATLLLATGVGSLWSAAIVRRLGGQIRFASYAVAVVILVEHLVLLPRLPSLLGLSFPARVLVTAVLVGPIGCVLGVFVPTALERLKPEAPAFVPWAWGINGMFSVLAPLLSVAVSMTWGISALLLAAIPVYLVVGWVYPRGGGLTPSPTPP